MIDVEKWVTQNLGRGAYISVGRVDIQVRVVGYNLDDNRAIAEFIDERYKYAGWSFLDSSDIAMLNCSDGATFIYVKLEDLKLKPRKFELPAAKMLDALEEITRNFAQSTKVTAYDLKQIKKCITTLKSKIYELK